MIFVHAPRNALIPGCYQDRAAVWRLDGRCGAHGDDFRGPVIGRLVGDAINNKDFPLVQGTIMTFAIMYALINLVVDVLYAVLIPA